MPFKDRECIKYKSILTNYFPYFLCTPSLVLYPKGNMYHQLETTDKQAGSKT